MNKKIANLLNYCQYCDSNTHKLKNCSCDDFIQFKQNCDKMKLLFKSIPKCDAITNLRRWLINYYIMNDRLLYYFAVVYCNLPSRINNINSIVEHIINWQFPKPTQTEEFIPLQQTLQIGNIEPANMNSLKNAECCICFYDNIYKMDMVTLSCGHEFCKFCLHTYLQTNESKKQCFLCREQITDISVSV